MADSSLIASAQQLGRLRPGGRLRLLRAARIARFAACTAIALAILLLPHLFWLLVSRRSPSPFGVIFHKLICWSIGLRVERRGEPFSDRSLIVANHISWTDILVLGASARTQFVAKAEVGRWPLLGWLARLAPTLFIDRGARCAVRSQVAVLATALNRGHVALFPEGTTGNGATVLPFNPALFESAEGRPVHPVSIRYRPLGRPAWQAGELADFAWDGDKPFLPHFLDVIGGSGVVAHVTGYAPIPAGDRKARASMARTVIMQALQD